MIKDKKHTKNQELVGKNDCVLVEKKYDKLSSYVLGVDYSKSKDFTVIKHRGQKSWK